MKDIRLGLKHNFLKEVVFRMDFDGVMEPDVQNFAANWRDKMVSEGYTTFRTRTEDSYDLEVKANLNIPDENKFSVNRINRSTVYRFSSENKEVIELSKSFFTFTVSIDKKYESFDKYHSLLSELIVAIQDISPYFKVLRIGLRKINLCYLYELASLSNYFKKGTFNLDELIEQFGDCKCIAGNMNVLLLKNNYQINYIRNIQEGVMQTEDGEKSIYQIALDVDVFSENKSEMMNALNDNTSSTKMLEEMNITEFEVYINSLKAEFIEKMSETEFNDPAILGVN